MMRAALSAIVALTLTACAGSSDPVSTTSQELHVYNWTDYIDPNEVTRFENETGIKVILDVYDSNETLLAKIQSGATGYDIIFPADYMAAQMRELNLLEPIDVASFPNGKNIMPSMLDVYWDPGRKYTAPYMYGTTGIACNPIDPFCPTIKSWHDFFTTKDPKVSVLKDEMEVVSAALRAVGVAGNNLCTTDKTKFQAALDLLMAFKPAIIESDGATERMLNGTNTLEHTWNGEVHRMRPQIPNMIYIYPTDGANLWADNIAVPVGAPHLDNAKTFINWLMDPKNIAAESNFTGYDNNIVGSDEFMDKSIRQDPAVIPPADVVSRLSPAPNCSQDVRDMYTQVFTSWTSNQ